MFYFDYIKMTHMEQPIVDSRYKNGKIYKLVCDATPIVYYGSTTDSLSMRLRLHKIQNCSSKELFDAGNVSIELIEEYPCNNKHELLARERIYIEFMSKNFTHTIICNKKIPNRTSKEYRQDNREHRNEYSKKYNQDNKESINIKKREKFNCDCGGKYTRCHKSQHLKTKQHLDYINSLGIE